MVHRNFPAGLDLHMPTYELKVCRRAERFDLFLLIRHPSSGSFAGV